MVDINGLTDLIIQFRDERDWKQFHNLKDLAISLSLEAGEVLEHFQWKNPEEIDDFLRQRKEELADELADVLYWVLLISHDTSIDIEEALKTKMVRNAKKYPVDKSKGNHKKYSDL